MRRICLLLLLFIFLINTSYASDSNSFIETKQTSIYAELLFDSELKLPMEGESVDINFIMTPYLENIDTNESYYVYYYFLSPDGSEYLSYDFPGFPQGPYEYGKKYNTHITHSFDTPGVWRLYFFVTTKDNIKNNSNQYIKYLAQFSTKRINVLSYYEANSMIQSNNSYKVSIVGVIGTLLAFILGTFLNYLYDIRKLSPKIKVQCSHGSVNNRMSNNKPIKVFKIQAINYGRISVTLSSVGIEYKTNKEYLAIIYSDINPIEFPKELLPGTSYEIIMNYENLKNNLEGKNPKRAFVNAQINKKYYSKNIEKMFK